MTLRRTRAVARKEALQILRDSRSLGLAFLLPVLLLILYGYALKMDVDHVPLVVWDQGHTPASRALLQRFAASRYFELHGLARSYPELEHAIDTRAALLVLVIPLDYAQAIAAGRPTAVQAIVDGSDPNTGTLALAYTRAVLNDTNSDLALTQAQRHGQRTTSAPLDPRVRVWYNTDLESRHFIIPGLVAVIMMVISALLTSLTVAREWERGTMEQLISTPVTPAELIIGKLIPYFAIGMTDVLVAALMAEFLFAIPLRGNPLVMLLVSAIFMVGALAMGMAISVVSKTQLMANQIAMVVTFLPAFLLSGFIFPITNMPHVIQLVTYLIPARYFIACQRAIYLKGLGLPALALEVGLLSVFAVLIVNLAVRKLVKKLR